MKTLETLEPNKVSFVYICRLYNMSDKNKQRILVTARKLFMRYGIKSVSMDDLASELGISKKTLYKEVANKEDLIKEIIRLDIEMDSFMSFQAIEQGSNALDAMLVMGRYVVKKLRGMPVKVIFELKKYYPSSFQLFEDFHQNFLYEKIKENIEQGIKEGLYREDLNPGVIARLYVRKNLIIVDEDSFPLDKYHRDKLFEEHFKYHIRGIASSKGIELLDKYAEIK